LQENVGDGEYKALPGMVSQVFAGSLKAKSRAFLEDPRAGFA
jgi:hypothetical protein